MKQRSCFFKLFCLAMVFSLMTGCKATTTSNSSSATATPWYFMGGGDFQHGIIIESVEMSGDWIACSFWRIESNGYVFQDRFEADTKSFNIPSLVTPSPAEHQSRIQDWKKRGYSVRITDQGGNITEISNVLIHYYPPSGYQYMGAQYSVGTELDINSNGDVKTVEFKEISKIEVKNNTWTITYQNGDSISGLYSPKMYDDLTFRAVIHGIQYGPDGSINAYELPIGDVGSMVFVSSPQN